MADLAFNFDHESGWSKVEVHPCDGLATSFVDDLARGARKSSLSAKSEKAPLQLVRPSRVNQHSVEFRTAVMPPTPPTSHDAEKEVRRCATVSNGGVDCVFQLFYRAACGQVDNGASWSRTSETVHMASVGQR